MYVCMYVCIYVCTYVLYVCMYVCMCVSIMEEVSGSVYTWSGVYAYCVCDLAKYGS